MSTYDQSTKSDGLIEKLISVRRTSKVVKGGRIFGFSAYVVVGDGKGRVGLGKGKSREVPLAIQKGLEAARKHMFRVRLSKGTLYHKVEYTHCASKVIMLPASEGTGIIAGGAMRAVLEVAGVTNVLAKCIGSTNGINVAVATLDGLRSMSSVNDVTRKLGRPINQYLLDKEAEVANNE